MRIRTLALASLAATAIGLVAAVAPAQAAEKPRHCVADVSTPVAVIACYDSFTTAMAKATGGRITDAPDAATKAVKDPRFTARLNALATTSAGPGVQASAVIEIDYDDAIFGGTFTWSGSNGGCETNPLGVVKYSVFNIADFSSYWNDQIDSFQNFGLCYSRHFEHAGFQGLFIGWDYPGRGNLGALDDEISSIQWS